MYILLEAYGKKLYMNFFKKLFGRKEEEGQVSRPMDQMGDKNNETPMHDSGEVKEEHEKGHPNGGSGKNVCEFC